MIACHPFSETPLSKIMFHLLILGLLLSQIPSTLRNQHSMQLSSSKCITWLYQCIHLSCTLHLCLLCPIFFSWDASTLPCMNTELHAHLRQACSDQTSNPFQRGNWMLVMVHIHICNIWQWIIEKKKEKIVEVSRA